MKSLFIIMSVLGLSACTAAPSTASTAPTPTPETTQVDARAPVAPKVIYLAGLSNELAADALYHTLLKANYLVTKVASNKVAVQFGDNQFMLEPNINAAGIDRILMNRFYAVHPKLQASQDLLAVIGQLNAKLNFAKFILLEQNSIIQVQGTVTFADSVEIEELRRFMLWTNSGLTQIAMSLPEGIDQYLRPIPLMSPTKS